MRSRDLPLALLALAAALWGDRPASACGPDFPVELLADRGAAVAELPEGIFADEAARLVPAHAAYRDPCFGVARTVDEQADDDADRHAAYSAAMDACHARRGVATPGLLEATLYRAGAAAFHAGRPIEAAGWFRAVLALPGPLRRQLSTSAAYSLGRLHVDDRGRGSYRRVRALVDAGYVDPDGLAAASLRNQAALTDDVPAALPLLAERAALGYDDAARELLAIARAELSPDQPGAAAERSLAALVTTALGQRLVGAYLYSRADELTEAQRARAWAALAAQPQVAGADRLAAAAYRDGQWDRAALLTERADDTALNRWVRAKLAARAGDVGAAATLACDAAEALPATTACAPFLCGEYLARDRALVECAALELADDRPVDAMGHAWAARGRYRDALYIADRVLTVDELGAFVATVSTEAGPADAAHTVDTVYEGFVTRADLEAAYARRLIRAGRIADALPHLPGDDRPAARAYAGQLALASLAPDRLLRAEALYRASMLARAAGMELLGTAHAPDWAIVDGGFDLATYTSGPDSLVAGHHTGWSDDGEPLPARPPSRWVSAAEAARVAAHTPDDPRRFHYRYLAVELAEAAAALVPSYTQAHRALRCWAADYPHGHSADHVAALRAFVVDGGPLPTDTCSAPDFAAARTARPPRPHRPKVRRFRDRHPRWVARAERVAPWAAGALGLACAAAVTLLVRRRQRRRVAVP